MRTVRDYFEDLNSTAGTVELGCGMVYRQRPNSGIEFYLGRRNDPAPYSYNRWSFFCGKGEPRDPTIVATARRETREETGVSNVMIGIKIGVYTTEDFPLLKKHVFEIKGYDGEPRATPKGFFEGRWFTPEQIYGLPDDEVTFGTKEAVRRYVEIMGFGRDWTQRQLIPGRM